MQQGNQGARRGIGTGAGRGYGGLGAVVFRESIRRLEQMP